MLPARVSLIANSKNLTILPAITCTGCGLSKSSFDYRKNRTSCKSCEYDKRDLSSEVKATRRYRAKNRAKINAWNRDKARQVHKWMDTFKSAPCTDCGKTFPPYVMDWDHIRDKAVNLSTLRTQATYSATRDRFLKEIEKCELVCANCHRVRTHTRMAAKGAV